MLLSSGLGLGFSQINITFVNIQHLHGTFCASCPSSIKVE